MRWIKWFPWRWVVSRMARSHGFMDPLSVLARLRRFAQPSEVQEPIELLRAGMVFHARGLINTRALQHNLDWVWPYWVEEQFRPSSQAFMPRGFSLTHTNLTHRNWTAVGRMGMDLYPIVDPRGLLTPHHDGWSLDTWIIPRQARDTWLIPSRASSARQRLIPGPSPVVETSIEEGGLRLHLRTDVIMAEGVPTCRLRARAEADQAAHLAVIVRPANPEGVSFIDRIAWSDDQRLTVDGEAPIETGSTPDRVLMSTYEQGDVADQLPEGEGREKISCDIGMASAAMVYAIDGDDGRPVEVRIPLGDGSQGKAQVRAATPDRESAAEGEPCRLEVPDERTEELFDIAVNTLALLSPHEVYPGPYTYKRFWFRDAVFILHAQLKLGEVDRVARAIGRFTERQTLRGYFHSQDGEWDSNGQVLWLLDQFRRHVDRRLGDDLLTSARRGAEWIGRKRVSTSIDAPHAGLLPAGFSAEHLGPNDYYYWDDFWSVAGLRAARSMMSAAGDEAAARRFGKEAESLMASIDRSLAQTAGRRAEPGVPASCYRRMDSGAIGSIVAGYPLKLWRGDDPRLVDTTEFLLRHSLVRGGFFLDVIHAGINIYLTLHLAQTLLRRGDERMNGLVNAAMALASQTGQWPEAIHPRTGGGCMGDGQHAWASAEWVMMQRNRFVREEGNRLILASGLPLAWLEPGNELRLGPTLTPWGPIEVHVRGCDEHVTVFWELAPRDGHQLPAIEVRLPGAEPVVTFGQSGDIEQSRDGMTAMVGEDA